MGWFPIFLTVGDPPKALQFPSLFQSFQLYSPSAALSALHAIAANPTPTTIRYLRKKMHLTVVAEGRKSGNPNPSLVGESSKAEKMLVQNRKD